MLGEQPETCCRSEFAGGKLRQILLALLLRAIGMDRVHDERGLDAHRRAEAGIDALDLARNKTIGHVAGTYAAISLGDGDAEQPPLRQFPGVLITRSARH